MDEIAIRKLLHIWGKSDDEDEANWHPLLFHLLDVGNVCRYLWDHVLPASVRKQITVALGFGEDEASARRLVVLLCAQHDLGKMSAFQMKVLTFWETLRDIAQLTMPVCIAPPHGFVTTKLLPDLVVQGIGGWSASKPTAKLLAAISGGHHGTFPIGADLDAAAMPPRSWGDAAWDKQRIDLLRAVEQYLFADEDEGRTVPPIALSIQRLDDATLLPLLGGLISVADWIGSSQRHFPPAGPTDLAEYAVHSRHKAAQALRDFGWTPTPVFSSPAPFSTLFGFSPNAMQTQVIEVADTQTSPYLLIVEAAMGEGKTEAAVYAIDRALSTGQSHGFYIALPTQATGNAMFSRVKNNYFKAHKEKRHSGDLNLQLVHSGSFMSKEFDKLRMAANGRSNDPEDAENGRVVAETWFTYRKRPLLAPFGVGTIDQSLTGVLQTKHWFVRLFGLAGKVVVFDEVHAYDIYMGELLGRLLGWLRLLGCTVILLSATLPASKRAQLIAAWNSDDTATPLPDVPYPRVTLVSAMGNDAWNVPATTKPEPAPGKQGRPDSVAVDYASLDFADLAQILLQDLPKGGCAAVICNTVTRAQEAYRVLRDTLAADGWEVLLFHARTISKWRLEREKQVLDYLGKDGVRPTKMVLIGTQVLEQSLDYDVDWMASEIAPIDLLLQRMGRLWRHERERPASITVARFYVLCGGTEGGLPEFPASTDRVYEPYVLLRTRIALKPGPVALPGSIEPLINAVYEDPEPADVTDAWHTALDGAVGKKRKRDKKESRIARAFTINNPELGLEEVLEIGSTLNEVKMTLYDDEDPIIHPEMRAATRLGDPSVSVICTGIDTNGIALANAPVKDQEISLKTAREMLSFGMAISHRGLTPALVEQPPPPVWKESPYLRYHRVLPFKQGIAYLGDYTLRLNANQGLQIEKGGEKTEE
jgi:CRISPR-associated endonuclease/helicase Cas3